MRRDNDVRPGTAADTGPTTTPPPHACALANAAPTTAVFKPVNGRDEKMDTTNGADIACYPFGRSKLDMPVHSLHDRRTGIRTLPAQTIAGLRAKEK